LLTIKAEAGERVVVNFEENVNLPAAQTVLSRLMVLYSVI